MALSDFTDSRRRWAWLLTISGTTVRYYSGQAPPTTAVPGLAGVNYTDVEAIAPDGVSSQSMRLDELGGVSEIGGLSVTLVSRGDLATASDPVRILGRVSRRGATAFTRLAETLQHDDAGLASVTVTDSLAAWPTTGGVYLFHIGQEMFRATGVAAGPPRFTGVTRAIARTRPQEHLFDAARGLQPSVTSEPVHWRTRRATLQAAPILGRSLTAADYVEVVAGFVDRTPVLARDGLTVSVDLAPLTMVLSQTVGGEAGTTYLTRGWHRFEPGVGDSFGVALFAKQAFVVNVLTAAPVAAGVVTAPTDIHAAMADLGLAAGHPRRLPMRVASAAGPVWDVGAYVAGPPQQYTVAGIPAVAAGLNWVNAPAWDVRVYQVTSGAAVLVQWPEQVLTALAGVTAWAPGNVAGAAGLWADVVPMMRADGSPAIRCKINGDVPSARIVGEFRANWSNPRGGDRDLYPGQGYTRNTHAMAHYAIQWCDTNDGRWFDPRSRGAFGEGARTRKDILAGAWGRSVDIDAVRAQGDAPNEFAIRGWPLAYYQTGEKAMLCDALVLPTSAAGTQWVQARWKEGGEEMRQIVPISSVGTQADGGGNTVGYLYNVLSRWRYRARSCGQWSESERVEIRAAAAWERVASADVVLQLLLSGRGRGVNSGTYDVLPFGANLDESEIRATDFDLRTAVAAIDEWSSTLVDSTTLAKVVEPILRASGVALTVRRYSTIASGYEQELTLTPVGVETPEVVASIVSADILADGRPTSETEDKPYARYRVSADYDWNRGQPQTVATYIDADAMAENGGDGGAMLDLEMRGLHLDNPADLITEALPLIDSIRARVGRPRRKYRLRLHAGWAIRLALGDVVELTAPDAIDYDGTRGVTAARCRVTGLDADWSAGTCEVELTSYGARTAGWAPAMIITAVPDAFTLTVDSNVYTDAADPAGDALQDSDYFAPSDLISIVPPGNWAGRISRTIVGVSGTTINLNPIGAALPGPLAQYVGQTVRPRPYDSTSAALRVYVYAADAARTLGAAADPARDWA